jgi:hypothetical protein
MGSVLMDRILYLSFPSWGWIHPYAFGSFSRMPQWVVGFNSGGEVAQPTL